MPRKNEKLSAAWYSVQDKVETARDTLKLVRPSLEALLDDGKARGKDLSRQARVRVRQLESQAKKQLARARREAGTQVARLRSRFIEATGVASKLQLEQLSHRITRLSKKVDALIDRGYRAMGRERARAPKQ